MCVGSPTAGTSSSSQSRPDNEFETDRRLRRRRSLRWPRRGPSWLAPCQPCRRCWSSRWVSPCGRSAVRSYNQDRWRSRPAAVSVSTKSLRRSAQAEWDRSFARATPNSIAMSPSKSSRLHSRAIPIDDALPIAKQIADAAQNVSCGDASKGRFQVLATNLRTGAESLGTSADRWAAQLRSARGVMKSHDSTRTFDRLRDTTRSPTTLYRNGINPNPRSTGRVTREE